jgi:hypothetical protein
VKGVKSARARTGRSHRGAMGDNGGELGARAMGGNGAEARARKGRNTR